MSDPEDIYILYGSQTGNSEDIAKDLNQKCTSAGLRTVCMTLNGAKKVALRNVAKCVVVVCSTTGNGDAPENCDAWWRSTKLRSAPKDTYADVKYTVLGLGDTNYDKFCHMGKSIHKRLGELGGKPFLDLHCADEATGLEDTVESWKVEVLRKLIEIKESTSSLVTNENSSPCIAGPASGFIDTSLRQSNNDNAAAEGPRNVLDLLKVEELSYSTFCEWVGIADAVKQCSDAVHLPNIKKLTDAYESTQVVSDDHQNVLSDHSGDQTWTASHPFPARVVSAKWLTDAENAFEQEDQWGSKKRVVHLELSLSGAGVEFSPGDSIGMCCPNPDNVVSFVLQRLQDSHGVGAITGNTLVSSSVTGQRELLSLNELLTYRLDLTDIPRKTSVAALSKHCYDKNEQCALEWISSKTDIGKILWSQFVEAQRLGIADLLRLFPSCKPSLGALVAISSAMSPRYYSIASSPLHTKDTVAVAFSIVRFRCGVTCTSKDVKISAQYGDRNPLILKRGLCTSFLEDSLSRWLFPPSAAAAHSGIEGDVRIKVFVKPSIAFRLPASVSSPLIFIGPGTGVAPFVGFLQHRAALERIRVRSGDDTSTGIWRGGFEIENEDLPAECNTVGEFIKSASPGPIHLFYGCRDQCDYLYREELNRHLQEHTLTSLDVAFSRISDEKVYVTHKIRERSHELVQLIIQEGAHVYICGDGNRMASDVQNVLKDALREHGGLQGDKLEEYYRELKLRRRLVLDIWS